MVDLAPVATQTFTGAALEAFFRHAEENHELYRVVLSGDGGAEPRAMLFAATRGAASTVFTRVAEHFGRTPRLPMDFISGVFIAAALYACEHWLAGDLVGTPADMAAMLMQAQIEGFGWSLGFEPGEIAFEPQES
jgi:hypothetical protein